MMLYTYIDIWYGKGSPLSGGDISSIAAEAMPGYYIHLNIELPLRALDMNLSSHPRPALTFNPAS